jgi:hypothetical protein
VFRVVFLVLFVAYPSVSIKLLRMFNCKSVGGKSYLEDDMRLQCYVTKWWGYAIYSLVMIAGKVCVRLLPSSPVHTPDLPCVFQNMMSGCLKHPWLILVACLCPCGIACPAVPTGQCTSWGCRSALRSFYGDEGRRCSARTLRTIYGDTASCACIL